MPRGARRNSMFGLRSETLLSSDAQPLFLPGALGTLSERIERTTALTDSKIESSWSSSALERRRRSLLSPRLPPALKLSMAPVRLTVSNQKAFVWDMAGASRASPPLPSRCSRPPPRRPNTSSRAPHLRRPHRHSTSSRPAERLPRTPPPAPPRRGRSPRQEQFVPPSFASSCS